MDHYLDVDHHHRRPQSMAESIIALPPPPRGPSMRRTHSPQSSANPASSRGLVNPWASPSGNSSSTVGLPPNRVFKFQATSATGTSSGSGTAAGTATATATSTSTATTTNTTTTAAAASGSWQQRRRPLISHHQPTHPTHTANASIDSTSTVISSLSTTTSESTTSSVDPASTAENEPRISISSTIYAASSDLSHDLHQRIHEHEEERGRTSLFYDNHEHGDREHEDDQRRQIQHTNQRERERERERDSFMDLYSPLNPQFDDSDSSELNFNHLNNEDYDDGDSSSSANVPGSPIVFSIPGGFEREHSTTERPPLPTTPKPVFVRVALKANSNSNSRTGSPGDNTPPPVRSRSNPSAGSSGKDDSTHDASRPPTTNFLDMDERADLVRKSKKLTRVFGQTPGAEVMVQQQESSKTTRTGAGAVLSGQARARAAFSLVDSNANAGGGGIPIRPVSAWQDGSPLVEGGGYLLAGSGARRHSMPMTPDDVSFLSIVSPTFSPTGTFGPIVKSPTGFDNDPATPAAGVVGADLGDNLDEDEGGEEGNDGLREPRAASPTSFMDLSDDDDALAPSSRRRRRRHRTPAHTTSGIASTAFTPRAHRLTEQPSIDTLNADAFNLEEERRRKRERLAKLHRFLGSRVPASLVLGLDEMSLENSLPPALALTNGGVLSSSESERERDGSGRKLWIKGAGKKRRSSSVVGIQGEEGVLERVREELDDKEKAINVRRAHKMEKVFGVAPPQTLYHTRHYTPSGSNSASKPGSPNPSSVIDVSAAGVADILTPTPIPSTPTTPIAATVSAAAAIVIKSNTHRASYMKTKTKKNGRPGTSESSKQLLPGGSAAAGDEYEHDYGVERFEEERRDGELGYMNPNAIGDVAGNQRHSFIYSHYQHSLKSLNDILDRDDRESLAELHEYLNNPTLTATSAGPEDTTNPDFAPTSPPNPNSITASATAALRRLSLSSLKSERRRSLPARTSFISLAPSEYTISPPSPIVSSTTDFQLRRRRAAKLAQFFGVNYRELINDVLESIESGVEHEQQKGTLRAEEVEDLLTKLRTLKTKRTGLF